MGDEAWPHPRPLLCDVLDCQCRHEFSDSDAWTALTDVHPKELRWPLCTGWILGWCRMLPMPDLILSYGCCPVVVDRCLMLRHTQSNHSPAWSKQWPGTASEVCLDLPTSNEQPLRWGWEPPCTVSLAHWCAPWMRGVSPTTTLLTPPMAEVCFQSGLYVRDGVQWNARLCTCGPQTWNHSLSPISV